MKKTIMKKIFLVALSFLIMFPAAACGSRGGDSGGERVPHDTEGRFYHVRLLINGLSSTGKTVYTVYSNDAYLKDNSGNYVNIGYKKAILIEKYDNLYRAIDDIYVDGEKGDIVIDTKINNANQTVFQREQNTNQIYLYTAMEFKGKAENETAAKKFLDENPKSHAIKTVGGYMGHSIDYMGTKPTLVEPESGSYIYKFARADKKYVKLSMTIRLKGAKIKFSDNENIPHNMYMFFSSTGMGGIGDFGFIGTKDKNGALRICYNTDSFGVYPEVLSTPVATDVPGEYEYQEDFYMEYTLKSDGFYLTVKNLETNEVISKMRPSQSLSDAYNTRSLLTGTSFVPDTNPKGRKIWDPRNGAYFKNIIYEDCLVYDESGNSFDFFGDNYGPSGTVTNCFAYADDGASVVIDNSGAKKKEINNIFYDQKDF